MESEGAIIPQLVESLNQKASATDSSVAGSVNSSSVHTIYYQKENILDERTRKDLFTNTFCKVCGAVLQFESQRISHYEGKKHAQKVRLYFQLHPEQEEVPIKKQKLDHVNFHVDGSTVVDKNRFCSLCNMVFTSAIVAQSHYVGKVHAKKMRQLTGDHVLSSPLSSQFFPQTTQLENDTVAQVTDTIQATQLQTPADEPKHQDADTELLSSLDSALDLDDPDMYCKLCSAPFNSPLMAQQHYSGKKHQRNMARRKMMEEMGDEAVPEDSSVGVGTYICPVCNITLTSIEMYQSHMQGNKHQIKENMVVNLMKHAKKTYDSFQDELADYIKVQQARGLEPKTCFRKTGVEEHQESFGHEEEGGRDDNHQETDVTSKLGVPSDSSHSFPEGYSISRTVESKLSGWSPVQDSNLRRHHMQKPSSNTEQSRLLPSSHSNFCSQPRIELCKDLKQSSSAEDDNSSSSSSSNSYRKARRQKRKHQEGRRCRRDEEWRREEETAKKKIKKSSEETDSGRDDEKLKSKKEKLEGKESANGEKSKRRKEKKNKQETPHKDKKHKKEKKNKVIDQRTEEEKLWDESILGF
ncbi:lysine-rich coiled-coil protein 1 [Microcaecilia unicolor]|uniref:Lysine-rich coiled-coil protein 1 n=1 Tax=Microcaecilia unicolor TaxID=1415580 RepID=A0A6P7X372_9AMPH|nr:lysine-rich coiled-coil protein 1 [Microcaecilia unicolor]